jgi:2-polyprenyl-6-hydroxyphenyl methylase/3-demethylubiquinone-9 3-methyltransferase
VKPPVFDPSWPADVQALYRHDMQEIWDRSIAPQVWNQYHNQLDLYCSFADGRGQLDILDVGCAQGTLALLLAERGHRVCAMDIRQQFLDYAASRHEKGDVRFVCGNATVASPDGTFDLIFANQIVEHLFRPALLIGKLAGLLKPGGRLVVTTPNWAYVKNDLPSFAEIGDPAQHEHSEFSADADGHFFAYRASELATILESAGLSRISVKYFESPWISGHIKVRYLHHWLPSAALRWLDALTLRTPGLGERLAHQLMLTGESR